MVSPKPWRKERGRREVVSGIHTGFSVRDGRVVRDERLSREWHLVPRIHWCLMGREGGPCHPNWSLDPLDHALRTI